MLIEQIAIPALNLRPNQVVAGVKIDRSDGAFGRQDLLAALVERVALRGVGRLLGLGDQGVLVGVLPAGLVVAAVRGHDVQERAGVEVEIGRAHV